jgi:hydroxymethylpyrimidine pyrophosphatase-like HAD family hydrolase
MIYIDEIENKIFHGINLKYYKSKIDDLEILKRVLESGKIMSRDDLKKSNYNYSNLPYIYEQSDDETCFAIHPKNQSFIYVYDDDFSEAFYQYIRFNISFVLSENILSKGYSLQFGIPGEVRIPSSISLKENLVAIGCFDEIEFLLEKIKICKEKRLIFSSELLSTDNIYEYTIKKKNKIYAIREILKEYGYGVPVIDPFFGNIIEGSYEDDILKARTLKNMLLKKR